MTNFIVFNMLTRAPIIRLHAHAGRSIRQFKRKRWHYVNFTTVLVCSSKTSVLGKSVRCKKRNEVPSLIRNDQCADNIARPNHPCYHSQQILPPEKTNIGRILSDLQTDLTESSGGHFPVVIVIPEFLHHIPSPPLPKPDYFFNFPPGKYRLGVWETPPPATLLRLEPNDRTLALPRADCAGNMRTNNET